MTDPEASGPEATGREVSVAGADWLGWPQVQAVMAALEAEGGPGCARFVGGAVRNTLLDQPVDDVDVATRLRPEKTVAALERGGLKAVPTGIEHGTVTAVAHGRPVEVTSLRRDVETDGRRALVAFTDDWAEDAARRDFRLNALYADASGTVFDPVGGGVDDALAGRIVFVGDPETRIREDYLRILRFFRFGAWYGRDWPDERGLQACAGLRDTLHGLSAERVGKELLKLLAAPDPGPAVRAMADAGVLDIILPGWSGLERLERLGPAAPELRLAALLQTPEDAATAAARLRLSNAQRARVAAALGPAPPVTLSEAEARALIHRWGGGVLADRLRLACAADPDCSLERIAPVLALAAAWSSPAMPVTGDDLMAAGLTPGPAMGQVLRRLEQAWVHSGFTLGRDDLLAQLGAGTETRP